MAQIQAAQRDKDPTGRESQTVVRVDNSPLPTAQELEAIQRINPELVSFVNAGSNQRKADQLANLRERATPPQKGKK